MLLLEKCVGVLDMVVMKCGNSIEKLMIIDYFN